MDQQRLAQSLQGGAPPMQGGPMQQGQMQQQDPLQMMYIRYAQQAQAQGQQPIPIEQFVQLLMQQQGGMPQSQSGGMPGGGMGGM